MHSAASAVGTATSTPRVAAVSAAMASTARWKSREDRRERKHEHLARQDDRDGASGEHARPAHAGPRMGEQRKGERHGEVELELDREAPVDGIQPGHVGEVVEVTHMQQELPGTDV